MFQTTKSQRRKIARAWRERNVTYLLRALLFHLKLSHLCTFRRDEYRMRVFYTPFAFWLWSEQARERSDEFFYRKFLRADDTVVDAGANIGLCTLLSAAKVGSSGQVFAYEPHPRTYKQLQQNCRLNKFTNTVCYNLGVSNKSEALTFTDEYVSDINHVDADGSIAIALDTIDNTLPKDIKDVTLLKIDVEGYELFALGGAQKTLIKTKVIYFESATSSYARYGYTLGTVRSLLTQQGFAVYKLGDTNQLIALAPEYQTMSGYENLIAVRLADFDWLQGRLLG
jgi:FkbM family methyltransferase